MSDSTKLSGYPYSPTKCVIWHAKTAYSCKKEVRPSKVESYLKDECMKWLTTRGGIWMQSKLKYTDNQCIDQELGTYLIYCTYYIIN